jgi:hypothetical protein
VPDQNEFSLIPIWGRLLFVVMFEDFKDKIREHKSINTEKTEHTPLSPEVLEKLKQQGINPETVTLAQLFPECLDPDGNDLSLMPGAEWEI